MNKNILAAVIVGVIAVIGGAAYFLANPSTYEPTPVVNIEGGGAPIVEVKSNASTTNSTALVNGTVNPNGANTKFWYRYGQSPSNLNSSTIAYSIGSGYSPIPAAGYIEDLEATTTYYYRLVAENAYGKVESPAFSFKTTNEAPMAPGRAPSANTKDATDVERTIARLNGDVNPRGWPTTYWFEYGTSANLGLVTSVQSAGQGVSSINVNAQVSGLSALTKYYFRLNSQNQHGTVNGDILTFTTTGPISPTTPTVYTDNPKIGSVSATLRGRVNPNASKTTYWFEYAADTTLGSIVANSTPEKHLGDATVLINVEANVTGLNRNTRYFYRLMARNELGTTHGDIEYFTTAK